MSHDGADLDDLLLDWEERRERGEAITPEALCAAVPHLINELARRIRLLEDCDRLLAVKTVPEPTEPTGGPDAPAPESVAGYEVLGVLGRGGMGVVYKARDPVLCRVVAVKALRTAPPAADADDRRRLADRFRREGQVLARLRHEAIVPVFEARVHDGAPCFVMEYEPGGSLADHRKRLTAAGPAAVVPLLERVARAVAHVHRQGVLHRDLKPANLLFDADGRVRVSDFGLAKLIDPERADRPATPAAAGDTAENAALVTQLTAPGMQPGTWAYMAPEQYDPASFGPVGPAADVWALGVILYELLTGRRPFPGRTWGELREQVCAGAVPPAPEVGRRLRRIVGRCLAKDPARRFRTADELADALKAAAPHRRWRVAAALTAALALAAGYAYLPRTRVAPAWPDLPAVRGAQNRLARGEDVVLIDHGPPAAFDWAMGSGSGKVLKREDGLFAVNSTGSGGCLVELLPGLPPGRYEVETELRHDRGGNEGVVGIYAAGSRCHVERGWQNLFASVTYADIGPLALVPPEAPSDRTPGCWVRLQAHHLGETDRSDCVNRRRGVADRHVTTAQASGQVPASWRRIRLRVDEAGLASWWGEERLGRLDEKALNQLREDVCRQFTDLPAAKLAVNVGGSLGIYVYNGAVTVRQFRVRPLSSKLPSPDS